MPYRILSLDGGGTWALLQALVLQDLYQNRKRADGKPYSGHDILKDFNLVIANSGGSMVLAGLIENMSPAEIISLFTDKQQVGKIFSRLSWPERLFPANLLFMFKKLQGFGPKYSALRKLEGLRAVLPKYGNASLADLPSYIGKEELKLLICSFNASSKRAKFFRSDANSPNRAANVVAKRYPDLIPADPAEQATLAFAVHASSNAPLNYFDLPAVLRSTYPDTAQYYWDGALGGFNNPVAAGIIEAVSYPDVQMGDLQILSLGTGTAMMTREENKRQHQQYVQLGKLTIKGFRGMGYLANSLLDLVKTILYEPPDWSNYIAFVMRYGTPAGHNVQSPDFIRLSPLIYAAEHQHPRIRETVERLRKLDMDVTTEAGIDQLRACFEHWKAGELPNQPIQAHLSGSGPVCAIGQATYAEGIGAWRRLTGIS
ncbi:MAG: patatin-like phospholipase family protein [Bacteroidia bacterium]|nr:patatin-like phospholipase family protein [Bacteroidia bacterium]